MISMQMWNEDGLNRNSSVMSGCIKKKKTSKKSFLINIQINTESWMRKLILTGEILGIEIMHLNEIKVLMKY